MSGKWIGAKYYNDVNRYTQQNNNATENIMKLLETCGPSSAVNCYDATHSTPLPSCRLGNGEMQVEDAFTMVMNNVPRYNDDMLKQVAGLDPARYPANEVIGYYPYFAKLCFNAKVELWNGGCTNRFKDVFKRIPGCAIQGWLYSPNHFICIKGYEEDSDHFLTNDPWNGRGSVHGFNRQLPFDGLDENIHDPFLVWYPQEYDGR